ncbi:alpha/beta hydrolase-fold protein [Psychroserpens sp. MEBiC05023]
MTSLSKTCFLICFIISGLLFAQNVSIGQRHSFNSEILNEERSYQVYLPPSYYTNPDANFPVVYLLDGDYNFHYDSGTIEFLSNSAFTIPELILIGISDKGSTKQLENSNPQKNADNFIKYIQSELKPLINASYRTTNLDILVGHSKFGLFATHYWMKNSNDFDMYLAIDPSYWFNEYEIVKRLESEFKNGFVPNAKLFIAQASTKDMGIDELVVVLKKEDPDNIYWQLNAYPNDNHGSLHVKAITDVLNTIFDGWDLDRDTFYTFKNGNEVVNHYKTLNDRYDSEFLLPWYSLGNITYYYLRNKQLDNLKLIEDGIKAHFPASLEEYYIQLANTYLSFEMTEDAEKLFKTCLFSNPKSFKAMEGLSKIAVLKKDIKTVNSYLEQAISIAKEQHVRQYYLNILESQFQKD